MSDPRSEYFGQLRHESAPPDHIFGRRMEVLTLAVLSQLHAPATSTGSRASGSTATRRPPSSAAGGRVLRARGRRRSDVGLAARAGHAQASCRLPQPRGRGTDSRPRHTRWIWTRLVVPGRPLGQPGGDPDARAGLDPAELDHAPRGVGDQLLGDLVAAHRGRLHAPHQAAAADRLLARARARRSAPRAGGRRPAAPSGPTASARPARPGAARARRRRRCRRPCTRGRARRAGRASSFQRSVGQRSCSVRSAIAAIIATASTGYCADRGLLGEHHRVGAVEDRVGHVGHLGAGRARGGDHRVEHLRGGDRRAGRARRRARAAASGRSARPRSAARCRGRRAPPSRSRRRG